MAPRTPALFDLNHFYRVMGHPRLPRPPGTPLRHSGGCPFNASPFVILPSPATRTLNADSSGAPAVRPRRRTPRFACKTTDS